MKIIGGLGVVVIASIALLQPAQGRPARGGRSSGGGHAFSSGHHFSGASRGTGRYGQYAPRARPQTNGQRYQRSPQRVSSQAAARNRANYARAKSRPTATRATALKPKSTAFSNSRSVAARDAALRAKGFDSRGRVPNQASRNWDRSRDHHWHGHRCRWYNNAWVVIDFWPWYYPWDYPWSYGYYGPYAYYDPGYYENVYQPASYSPEIDESVRDVQAALAKKGYYHGAIDGVIGPQTRSAVRQYQRNHGLEVTGNIDQPVVDTLWSR